MERNLFEKTAITLIYWFFRMVMEPDILILCKFLSPPFILLITIITPLPPPTHLWSYVVD